MSRRADRKNFRTETGGRSPRATVVEVRMGGKLHDLILEGPEHAVRNALKTGGPYQEVRVVDNPNGYDLENFLRDLVRADSKELGVSNQM